MSERFTLANRDHLEAFVALLAFTGALCPECGHGTRKTSKRWARCKQCNTRVERKPLPTNSIPSVRGPGDEGVQG